MSVRRLCALFGGGRTWHYGRPRRPAAAEREVARRAAVERPVLESPGYGCRQPARARARAGWGVDHKRVLRVMREEGLLRRLQRRFVATTDPRHGLAAHPDLLAGRPLHALDEARVADSTPSRLPTTFVHPAPLLDACSRCCAGWKPSRDLDTGLTLAAPDHALARRRPAAGLIHHPDRGVQDAGGPSVARWREAGARSSMAARGNPYDNPKAERSSKPLQREEVERSDYRTVAEAEQNLGRFIEDVDHRKRPRPSLGCVPPAEFEAAHRADSDR